MKQENGKRCDCDHQRISVAKLMESLSGKVNFVLLNWWPSQPCQVEERRSKTIEQKSLNSLFWHDMSHNYIIKVYSLQTEIKMPTGMILKVCVYDVYEKHVVQRPGPVCTASLGAWTLSGCQLQQHTGKNFQCVHHTSIFLFGFTLSSSTVLKSWSWSEINKKLEIFWVLPVPTHCWVWWGRNALGIFAVLRTLRHPRQVSDSELPPLHTRAIWEPNSEADKLEVRATHIQPQLYEKLRQENHKFTASLAI